MYNVSECTHCLGDSERVHLQSQCYLLTNALSGNSRPAYFRCLIGVGLLCNMAVRHSPRTDGGGGGGGGVCVCVCVCV